MKEHTDSLVIPVRTAVKESAVNGARRNEKMNVGGSSISRANVSDSEMTLAIFSGGIFLYVRFRLKRHSKPYLCSFAQRKE